ncbi:hypothetical protein DIPPA_22394 [Diplonema papillatum]|nr:hypothetical protein DIPPA_22394 [Diplonema papillatum]|eukprot:gene7604-11645_t
MARKPKKKLHVPCCTACGEQVAGHGRYCSACGAEVGDSVFLKYVDYLEKLDKMGLLHMPPAECATREEAEELKASNSYNSSASPGEGVGQASVAADNTPGGYAGERGVFKAELFSIRPPWLGSRRGRPAPPAKREKIDIFCPLDGPRLNSTPLSLTKVAASPRLDALSVPGRKRYKAEGSVTFVDERLGKSVVVQRTDDQRLVVLVGKKKVYVDKVVLSADPPRLITPDESFCLPEHVTEREEVVAKLLYLAHSHGVPCGRHVPVFPERATRKQQQTPPAPPGGKPQPAKPAGSADDRSGGGKEEEPDEGADAESTQLPPASWLYNCPPRKLPVEQQEKLAKRLHDDFFVHAARLSTALTRKHNNKVSSSPSKVISSKSELSASNQRLYYMQVERKRRIDEKNETFIPLCKTVQLDADSIGSATARLYGEVDRKKDATRALLAKYVPAPPKSSVSPEQVQAAVLRLHDEQQDKSRDRKTALWQRHVGSHEKQFKKMTQEEQASCVSRLTAKE